MRSKNARMVAQFRHHFGLPVRSFPDPLAADLDLHGKLLAEEVSEFLMAVKEQDPVEVVDALGDILYVVYGAELGLHYRNLTKIRSLDHPWVLTSTAKAVAKFYKANVHVRVVTRAGKIARKRAQGNGWHDYLHWVDVEKGITDA